MARSVFISYAAKDPDWPAERVRALAEELQQRGATVLLDQFHQDQVGRRLSIDEWRRWMRQWVHEADHILCLASPRYLKAADRSVDDPTGYGVAFESLRFIHQLYENKGYNDGRIVVARPEGMPIKASVPEDFRTDCPLYEDLKDREDLHRDLTRSLILRADNPSDRHTAEIAAEETKFDPCTVRSPGFSRRCARLLR